MTAFIKTGELPTPSNAKQIILKSANFSLVDDVLYYTQPDGRLLLVVPKDQRQQLIQEAHGGVMAGHLREMKYTVSYKSTTGGKACELMYESCVSRVWCVLLATLGKLISLHSLPFRWLALLIALESTPSQWCTWTI
jgi:hypothetical protein